MIGPFKLDALPRAHVSHLGIISKNHQPGKWRLIVDLSHPAGVSMNDGKEPEMCTHYTSMNEAVKLMRS